MKYVGVLAAGICGLIIDGSGVGTVGARSVSSFHNSTATIGVPSAHLLVCPQGDGQSLAEVGATITIQVIMDCCAPVPGALPEDLWVVGCNDGLALCGGSAAIDADAPTDENGMTTMSATIKAGGSDAGLFVVILNSIAYGSGAEPICLPITVVSPDIDGDLDVDIVDLALFAGAWPPGPYSPASDLNGDGVVDLIDFALFAEHFMHACQA